MLVSCPAAACEADPAGMSSGEPSATTPMGGLLLNPVLTFYSGLSQPFKRGHQRLTFRQYASYSAPNFRRSVGSSYRMTNRCTPRATAATAAIASRFACPKTIQSPSFARHSRLTPSSRNLPHKHPRLEWRWARWAVLANQRQQAL